MARDWLADVRKYDAGADENVVAGIVRYCGIALRTENASRVSFAEKEETDRVRDNFLKKKLGLAHDDATLDGAIQSVGAAMGGGTRNRVSVYYLLAKHFGMLEMFNKPPKGAKKSAKSALPAAAPATAATTATAATATSTAATPTPISTAMSAPPDAPKSPTPTATGGGAGAPPTRPTKGVSGGGDNDAGGFWGIAALAGGVMFGAILFAAIAAIAVKNTALTADPADTSAPAAAAPAEPAPAPEPTETTEPEVPEGAGVTATERDGQPVLNVYFDSGSSDVSSDFASVSQELVSFLEANPDASVTISGYNDPTGNAEINARLSRERAENVQAALVAAGIDEGRTELVKPDDTTTTDMSAAEARRVEITITE